MTLEQFRKAALSIPGASESAHMNHPDFRIAGKVFATLGYPDEMCGMVKLTPEQQQDLVKQSPDGFFAAKGAWGIKGATCARLAAVKLPELRSALALAAANLTSKS